MKKFVFDIPEHAAQYAAQSVKILLQQKPNAVLCLAAGHTSLPVFDALVTGGIDFSHARFIGLDEWVGVAPDTAGSCAKFLHDHFFARVCVNLENMRLFDALAADLDAECAAMERQIEDWGGIDFLLLGMGMNGHLALNEPGDCFDRGAHVAPLSETTKRVAPKYFPGDMPPVTSGITLGIRNFTAARLIQLTVFGAHKAACTAQLLALTPTEAFPATILHTLPHAELLLDAAAAGTDA